MKEVKSVFKRIEDDLEILRNCNNSHFVAINSDDDETPVEVHIASRENNVDWLILGQVSSNHA